MSKEIETLTADDFVTPKGTTIIASCDLIPGTAGITADDDGWEHDGETEVDWDGQEQEKDGKGRGIWLDDADERWVWSHTGWEAPAESDPIRDAAPAMLAALEIAARHIPNKAMEYSEGTHGDRVYALDVVNAAIAAARGEG
jgi:hypothetical protein